jgi:hypothetical protein
MRIKAEPRMDIRDIFGAFFIALGFLLFLINLHLMTINESGNTQDVLNTTFMIFLYIFEVLLILAMAFIIIHFLKWLVWSVQTPKWMKNKIRKGNLR